MKKLLFVTAAMVCGFAMPLLSASDYGCCPQTQGCDPCCEMDFGGLYVGGNIGAITHSAYRNDLDGFLTDNGGWTSTDTNFTAGVQLGYDWVCCNTLLGLVVDWNWANNDHRLQDDPNDPTNDSYSNHEFNWFTTVRARAGVALCDTIFYITAGAAVASHDITWRDAPIEFNHHRTRWGWAGGVGTEFKAWCNWTLGAELLFVHFDNDFRTFRSGTTSFTFAHSDTAWIGRIVLNYRFGDLCSLCSCW